MTEGTISYKSKSYVWVRVPYGRGAHRILTFDRSRPDAPTGDVGDTVQVGAVRSRPGGGWTT